MKILNLFTKKAKSERLSKSEIETLQKVVSDCEWITKLCKECYNDVVEADSDNKEFVEVFADKIQRDERRIENFKKRMGVC